VTLEIWRRKSLENVMKKHNWNFNRLCRNRSLNLIWKLRLLPRCLKFRVLWKANVLVMVKMVRESSEQYVELQQKYKKTLSAYSVRSPMVVKLLRSCTWETNTTPELNRISNEPRVLALETAFSSQINKPKSGCKSKLHLYDCNLCTLVEYFKEGV
jgi:hypothetical protein